jgi:hypothetical protein
MNSTYCTRDIEGGGLGPLVGRKYFLNLKKIYVVI